MGDDVINIGDLEKIISLLELADQLKTILRGSYHTDATRHENDAEHSWHGCLYVVVFASYSDPDINTLHVLEMFNTHDLVEVYAGDTYVYDEEARKTQATREEAAAKKLFSKLPEPLNKKLYNLWREFEDCQTLEAKYANAIDHLQATGQSVFTKGKTWHERKVTEERIRAHNKSAMETAPIFCKLFEYFYARAEREGLWYREK